MIPFERAHLFFLGDVFTRFYTISGGCLGFLPSACQQRDLKFPWGSQAAGRIHGTKWTKGIFYPHENHQTSTLHVGMIYQSHGFLWKKRNTFKTYPWYIRLYLLEVCYITLLVRCKKCLVDTCRGNIIPTAISVTKANDRRSTPNIKTLKAMEIYTTWKVDGATPTYWFIMALTNPPFGSCAIYFHYSTMTSEA